VQRSEVDPSPETRDPSGCRTSCASRTAPWSTWWGRGPARASLSTI